jgi:hypothetical protein
MSETRPRRPDGVFESVSEFTVTGKRHSRFGVKIPGSVENNSRFFAKPGTMDQAIDQVGVSARVLNPWFWSLELCAFRQNRGRDL